MKNQILFFMLILTLDIINTDSVCDLEMLLIELKQDIDDNGTLDCLRDIEPPLGKLESVDEMNKRLASQWDSSCSFESSSDWFEKLKNIFGIETLFNEIGEPVNSNNPYQADLCEIIRTLIKSGKFEGSSDIKNINEKIFTQINCPGEEGGVKICAVNGISLFKKNMWNILLLSSNISISNKPSFTLEQGTKKIFNIENIQEEDPGEPVKKNEIEALKKIYYKDEDMINVIKNESNFITNKSRPVDVLKRAFITYTELKNKENIIKQKGWKPFVSTNLEIDVKYESFVLSFLMISAVGREARLNLRLVIDEVDQISSRLVVGYQKNPSLTSGFISRVQTGAHFIRGEYRTNEDLKVNLKENTNMTLGAILIPVSDNYFYKTLNSNEIQLFNNNNFITFPNLNASFTFNRKGYVLIMYSLSMSGAKSHIVTDITVNTMPISESRSISGDSTYWGIHCAFIYETLPEVNYKIDIRYRTPSTSRSNPKLNDWESQSLAVLQLPEWFNMQIIKIEEEFTLESNDKWNEFPSMDIDLELEDDKSILFMYNIVLPLVEKSISVGIFVNNILEQRSLISYSGLMYFKAFGYFPNHFDKGKYKIHLKYLSTANITYKPKTDWQMISLTILDMN